MVAEEQSRVSSPELVKNVAEFGVYGTEGGSQGFMHVKKLSFH